MAERYVSRYDFKKNFSDEYVEAENNSQKFGDIKWNQILFNYLNNISEPPLCPKCKTNKLSFKSATCGYRKHCSKECSYSDVERINKIKQTNLKNCGFEFNFADPKFKAETKLNNLKRIGFEFTSQQPNIRNKSESTKREKNRHKISTMLGIDVENIEYNRHEITIRNYCKIHNEFTITTNMFNLRWRRYDKKICLKCFPTMKTASICEKEIGLFLSDLKIEYISGSKRIIKNREIDIYIPKHNLAIEYNGIFWHSTKYKEKSYHYDKFKSCEDIGVELIQIFEDEWIHNKDVIKSQIKQKLNMSDNKISASECTIKRIRFIQAIEFLKINSLKDFGISTRSYGMYYQDDLISVVSFDFDTIVTHCNKINIDIIGSIKSFIDNYLKYFPYEKLFINLDNRFAGFGEYTSIGFEFQQHIEPKRYTVDKNKIERIPTNEIDNNVNDKSLSIYDCGKSRLVLNII